MLAPNRARARTKSTTPSFSTGWAIRSGRKPLCRTHRLRRRRYRLAFSSRKMDTPPAIALRRVHVLRAASQARSRVRSRVDRPGRPRSQQMFRPQPIAVSQPCSEHYLAVVTILPTSPTPHRSRSWRTTDIVAVNETNCQIPAGQTTCPVIVSWSSTNTASRVFCRDLTTNVISTTPLTANSSGQYTDNLSVGDDVQYELRNNTDTGLLLYTSAEVKAIPPTPAGPATPTAPAMATPPADDTVSDGVGATAGAFSVDQQGNANYVFPSYAPRGAGGLTPSVSLTYNSGSGDGLVGYGWTIGGFPPSPSAVKRKNTAMVRGCRTLLRPIPATAPNTVSMANAWI